MTDRADGTGNRHHLFKQLRLLLVPPGCVNNDHVEPLLPELFNAEGGNGDGVRLGVGAVERNLGFGGVPGRSAKASPKPVRVPTSLLL